MRRESFRPALLAGVLVLLAAGLCTAQDKPARNSDTVRRAVSQLEATDVADKPASIQLIHKRTLLSSYAKFQDSLKGDVITLERMLAAADSADADTRAEIAAQIAHLNGERNDLASKIQRLRAELMSSAAAPAPPRERDAAAAEQPTPEMRNALYTRDAPVAAAAEQPVAESLAVGTRSRVAHGVAPDLASAPVQALDVEVKRVGNSGAVTVTVPPSAERFRITVTSERGSLVFSKTYDQLARGRDVYVDTVRLAPGKNTVRVSVLDSRGAELSFKEEDVAAEASAVDLSSQMDCSQLEGCYDWGRVRGYFAGGVVFSKERQNFSQTDMFLGFTLDKNYVQSTHYNINTYFSARLTSIPVAAADADTPGAGAGDDASTDELDTFLSSEKAAEMEVGVYLPVNVTAWMYKKNLNTLFIGPLAKGGIKTITSQDQTTSEKRFFGNDDVFNFYSFGVRVGHFKYPGRGLNPNVAPELVSWLDITTGRFENFELDVPTGQKDAAGNNIFTRQRRYRYEARAGLKIPETPFIIGFDGNFGKGPDDLRFLFGTRFDIGRLFGKLKSFDRAQAAAGAASPQ